MGKIEKFITQRNYIKSFLKEYIVDEEFLKLMNRAMDNDILMAGLFKNYIEMCEKHAKEINAAMDVMEF